MNKINLEKFLLENVKGRGTYALVSYDNKIEPTWFTRYNFGNGDWFLESLCTLRVITSSIDTPIDEFCKEYVSEFLEISEDCNIDEYIKKHIKPMIIDNCLYEIDNLQYDPYLPKEVDDIKLITEEECLRYLLK